MNLQRAAGAAARPDKSHIGAERFFLVLMLLCIIQFTGVWIYPSSSFGGVISLVMDKRFGVPFQYSVWALVLLGVGMLVKARGFAPLVEVLKPFLPFLLIGLVAGVFGYSPFLSMRLLVLWSVMACAAVAIGLALPQRRALRTVLWISLGLLLVSAVYALALPSYGGQPYASGTVWRGLFLNKNQLGWFASLTLVLGVMCVRRVEGRLPLLVALLSAVCLVGSGSKGALVASVLVIAYGYVLSRLRQVVTPGFGAAIVLFLAVLGGVVFALSYAPVLELLGRDATLSGRTSIWAAFFNAMADSPWLGQGPGSFSGLSPLTAALASRLDDLGAIVTPHSSYLAAFGDAGLFGLVAFVGMLVYLSLIEPLSRRTPLFLMSGTVCFLIAASGIAETHDVFTPGPGWFLLIMLRALALKEGRETKEGAEPAQPAQPAPKVRRYYQLPRYN
jgi:O-antigen ligase